MSTGGPYGGRRASAPPRLCPAPTRLPRPLLACLAPCCRAVSKLGTQWPKIARQLPGRTPDAVRNRYHRLQRTPNLQGTEDPAAGFALLAACGVPSRPEEVAAT